MPGSWSIPDWRDALGYAALIGADRSFICWEWLRRDAGYRRDATVRAAPEKWGLLRFEDPDRAAPFASPMWSVDRLTGVLQARAQAWADDADAFVTCNHRGLVLIHDGDCQHLSLSDGLRVIRLDISGARVEDGPVLLSYALSGFARLGAPLATLNRFRRFARAGRIEPERGSAHRQAREILLLRTWDAIRAGASQRDIAGALLGGDADAQGWRINDPSLRLRAQRIVRSARLMAAGNFWDLLR